MASETQKTYIADLATVKTKEFKEVKELILASGIVSDQAEIVNSAQSIAQITDALTDLQASQFIDVLIKSKTPKRENAYSSKRIDKTIAALDDIKKTIAAWTF